MAWTILDDHDKDRTQHWPAYRTRKEAEAERARTQAETLRDHGFWPSLSVVNTADLVEPYQGPDVIGEHVYGGGWLFPDR